MLSIFLLLKFGTIFILPYKVALSVISCKLYNYGQQLENSIMNGQHSILESASIINMKYHLGNSIMNHSMLHI